ncbi:FAD-dependent thymidylate synthase (plasmid) [Borrelia anserina]|uniref:Flavin-dependent thymidylate synthase n=2 Tax=Borrelia anserina TaxID=143 RepID=W5SP89_BORAN|nr:FAD-dependent thymidylate synthase [Borrelia anserina]AHH08989.1 Thymidylate synthase thyX [Borrelia anserina BA2]AHX39239.1 FAD-dependent thymidylate synthase [Borrelia anserina Es]APR65347.1 thymidylate synthase ThyX [Borrelia anserina Es]UPA07314.1 FAD-dependent thymidylate synthase [Borrelia anserina]
MHDYVKTAEEILDKEYKVLDKGFLRLVDYMGSDNRIVNAARVSYRDSKAKRDNAALIDYLIRNEHTSPLEQVVLTFHVKAPIFVARQWMRHRTSRINEVSGRYSLMREEFYIPCKEDIKKQSLVNKQGRSDDDVDDDVAVSFLGGLDDGYKVAYKIYDDMIKRDVSRELARITLPLSLYTEWYWQIDLNNLFRFIKLRISMHAQKEIREYASVILDIVSLVVPLATASFKEHILEGVMLSNKEVCEIRKALDLTKLDLPEKNLNRLKEKLNL